MTVCEFFALEKITRAMVEVAGEESDYHTKSSLFVLQNWNRQVESLSPNQAAWLSKIQEDLAEKRIEGCFN